MNKTRMTIRIVSNLNQELERISTNTGRSKNDLVVSACWEFLKEFPPVKMKRGPRKVQKN